MPMLRVSEDTKTKLDSLAKQLLKLHQQGGAPAVKVSRHRAGDFVSADEVVWLALEALQIEITSRGESES